MRSSKAQERPQVRLLLSVLSWLTALRIPDPAVQSAIAQHFHLLILHPAADSIDIQAGIYMARRTGMDSVRLLARYTGITPSLH
ncbi:MAG TPA: hypothetical protein VFS89_04200 [Nitrosospira sp.]|nr:hypothetical protein [Nitrosospira sp.]